MKSGRLGQSSTAGAEASACGLRPADMAPAPRGRPDAGFAFLATAALVAATLATLFGCGRAAPAVPPVGPSAPPAGWGDQLSAERQKKDRFFREDPSSPLAETIRRAFAGIEYYPPDPGWYFQGRLNLAPHPEPLTIAGSMGEQRTAERWASFTFLADGRPQTLQIYRLYEPGEKEGHPFLPFLDATTGRDTYPAGRYVEPEIDGTGNVIVDFNRAYYPWCAYGKDYDCPLVPAENRLEVAVRAGERGHPWPPPTP